MPTLTTYKILDENVIVDVLIDVKTDYGEANAIGKSCEDVAGRGVAGCADSESFRCGCGGAQDDWN